MTRSIRSNASARTLLTLVLVAGMLPFPAAAADRATEARQAFERAERDYEMGRFEEAIDGYARAFELSGFPELLFNLGQAHRQLGQWERAGFFYRRYLSRVGKPKNRKLVEDLIAEVDQRAETERKAEEARIAQATEAARAAREAAEAQTAQASPSELPPGALSPVPDAPGTASAGPPPVYQRWWFWAGVGAVVAAGATAYAVTSSPAPQQGTLGEVRF